MQVLIVDSNAQDADHLRSLLNEFTDSKVLCLRKASEALFEVEENLRRPQVCFIDVKPGNSDAAEMDGIALALRLWQLCPGVQIIFMSAYDSFYLDAYEVEHAWFLQKPIDNHYLRKAWNRAVQRLDYWESRTFSFRFAKTTHIIPLREILYFEKDRRKVFIHTTTSEESLCFYGSMDEVMLQLDHHFLRCHNSYVVNLTRVDAWAKTSFSIGQNKIPISRKYAKVAKAAFLDLKNEQNLHING